MQEAKLYLQPERRTINQLSAESPVTLMAILIIRVPYGMLHAMNRMEERPKAEVFKSHYTQNIKGLVLTS